MFTVFTLLLWAAFLIKVRQLLRAPDDRPLRAVALGLGSAAVAFSVGRDPLETVLDELVLGLPTLTRNLGMAGVYFAIAVFFVYTTQPHRTADRAVRQHTAIVGGILAVTTVIWILMPAVTRPDPRGGGAWGVLFLLAAVAALLYAAIVAARHTLRNARTAQLPRVRKGLGILSMGLLFSVAANVLSACSSLGLLFLPREHGIIEWVSRAYLVTNLVAIPGIAIGLAYPIVAVMITAVPTWWRHRRESQAMAPLWRQIRRAWPDIKLRHPAGVLRPNVHARRYRRAIEIRDGLVLLQPYLPVRAKYPADVGDYAADLHAALQLRSEARQDGSHPVGGQPPASVAHPQDRTIDDDIDWLTQLSRALVQYQRTTAS